MEGLPFLPGNSFRDPTVRPIIVLLQWQVCVKLELVEVDLNFVWDLREYYPMIQRHHCNCNTNMHPLDKVYSTIIYLN